MNHPYIIGASQVLLRISPFLAHAARVTERREDELVRGFERDLVLIYNHIQELSQHLSNDQVASLDNFIQQRYDFNSLNEILDRTLLGQALERLPMTSRTVQLQTQIHGYHAINELHQFASAGANLIEQLNYASSLPSEQVRFIKQTGDVSVHLRALLDSNESLQARLSILMDMQIQHSPSEGIRHPPSQGIRHSPSEGIRTISVHPEVPREDIALQSSLIYSRQSLKILYEALHSTWPAHANCNSHHPPGTLWHGCNSAHLKLSGTWGNEPESRELYDLLLCTNDIFYECEVKVHRNRISNIPDKWLFVCHPECTPSQDSKLNLFASEGQLHWNSAFPTQSERDWVDYEELRLSEFVPYNELKYREKLILTVILARSLLYCLGTNWLSSNWGMDDISVFYPRYQDGSTRNDGPRELNLRQAYISTHFSKAEGSVNVSTVHRQPRILRLGIVIMQLMLGDRLKDNNDLREGRISNREVKRASKLYKECELRFPKTGKVLKAFKSCTDTRLFLDTDETSAEVSKIYYNEVVRILEEALSQDEEITLASVEEGIRASTDESPRSFNALIKPELQRQKSNKRHYSDAFTEGKASSSSKKRTEHLEYYAMAQFEPCPAPASGLINTKWSKQQKQLTEFVIKGRSKPIEDKASFKNLIRVAVIDTGCNLDHSLLQTYLEGWLMKKAGKSGYEYRNPGIWGWKDFVDVNHDPDDPSQFRDTSPDGHGTFMTYLLLQTMPWLQVYIARVFEGSKTKDPETHDRVANAINHAVKHWNVHIISMSFHLTDEPLRVKEAIAEASKNGVLLFAAAGNTLQYRTRSIAFPASLPDVFCINSHDDNTKASADTPHNRDYWPNFMVIGQSLRGPAENGTKLMSGTSCATSIAAAFAAMVLDFIEKNIKDYPNVDRKALDLLKGVDGTNAMKWVFFHCMVESGTRKLGQYNVVNPGHLFRDDWDVPEIFSHIISAIERRNDLQLH